MATLLLHAVVAFWLLAARTTPSQVLVEQALPVWLTVAPERVPPPPVEPLPVTNELVEPALMPFLELVPETPSSLTASDWEGDARDVARAVGGGPARRRFGPEHEAPRQLKSKRLPPTVFERPLPRVGTTVTSPEGETIIWVSDNCYIPIESMSLTMQDFHKARQGIRRCQIGLGKRKPRDDLFEHLKKFASPEQQKPGCRPEGGAQSCTP